MNKKNITLCLFAAFVIILNSCGTKIPPVETRMAKIWTVSTVTENAVEVYKSGSATNAKPGYSSYRLDLSTKPTAILKDVDGGTYTGKYTIIGGNKLSITGLTPEPTGTGGNLDFSITGLDDKATTVILSATQNYPKTGNTKNVYTLVAGK
jgi:hypothetical protein